MAPAIELTAAFGTGLAVGVLSAIAGVGGGVLMVPVLYALYSRTPTSVSAQTVVAHATSLGVAFATSTIGTWRYSRSGAVAWVPAAVYAGPGILAAFVTARLLTRTPDLGWVRTAFGCFLLVSALDMTRRALRHRDTEVLPRRLSATGIAGLAVVGLVGGSLSSLLGIGGGLIAVPVLLYIGRLPVSSVAPTALAGVCLTTLAGVLGYLTASGAPAVSPWMAGFVDVRLGVPLAAGAALTVPLGVRFNRRARPVTLFWTFALIFGVLGAHLIVQSVNG